MKEKRPSKPTMDLGQTESFMREAKTEGRKAREVSAPNPPVGCVLVRDGEVVARGYTSEVGILHAEAVALSRLEGEASGLSAFVTLEPCSFQGRTPSCAKALIARGVETVYVGIVDPDPRNDGKGLALLREAGIEVVLGILEEEIRSELGPYLHGAT